jgi:hypothetical protein
MTPSYIGTSFCDRAWPWWDIPCIASECVFRGWEAQTYSLRRSRHPPSS